MSAEKSSSGGYDDLAAARPSGSPLPPPSATEDECRKTLGTPLVPAHPTSPAVSSCRGLQEAPENASFLSIPTEAPAQARREGW